MSVDLESLNRILKHPIRRKIVLTLLEKHELAYVDLMNLLEVEHTGKLNYHLKSLGDLIEKNENGKYRLTDKGRVASELLLRFPEKKTEHTRLNSADATLIGFLGFILAFANPGIWGVFFIGLGGLITGYLFTIFYGSMIPGYVMWRLTVKRTSSHDMYDLSKPPLVLFAIFTIFLILLTIINTQNIQFYIYGMNQLILPLLGLGLLPFLGVGISEMIYRRR